MHPFKPNGCIIMKCLNLSFLALVLASLTTTGCAGLPGSKSEKVDCVAKYISGTWPGGEHWVKVDERRVNHVGHRYVHVRSDLVLHFYGRWQREELFADYQCKKAGAV